MLQFRVFQTDHHVTAGAAHRPVQVLPFVRWLEHLAGDPLASHRVLEPLDAFFMTAFSHPGRHGRRQPAHAGVVGVDVARDIEPLGAGLLDKLDRRVELVDILPADHAEVIHLAANPGLPRNRDEFLDGVQEARSGESEMGNVQSVVLRRGLGQCGQLGGIGIRTRHLHQRRRDTHRTSSMARRTRVAHPIQFIGAGRSILLSELVDPQRRCADKRCDVGRDTAAHEVLQVAVQGGPLEIESQLSPAKTQVVSHRIVHRPHGAPLAHDFQSDALADVALRTAVNDERFLRVAQDIDEARSHGEGPARRSRLLHGLPAAARRRRSGHPGAPRLPETAGRLRRHRPWHCG